MHNKHNILSQKYKKYFSNILERINKKSDRIFSSFEISKGQLCMVLDDIVSFPYLELETLSPPKNSLKSFTEVPIHKGTIVLSLGKEMHGNSTGMKHPIWKFLHEGKMCFVWLSDIDGSVFMHKFMHKNFIKPL